MRMVIQRVKQARVTIDGEVTAEIGSGLLVFVAVAHGDTQKKADYLLDKLLGLRIFPDENGKMNRNISDVSGDLMIVSQFTLYADCRKGRRPSFDAAAPPDHAKALYDYVVQAARRTPLRVLTGVFQAHMLIDLVNDGPVTIIVDSIP